LGELGGNLLPLFPIKRQKGVVPRVPDPPSYAFQLFWVKKNCFREENPSRGASVTLPRCFREQIREGFSSFFIVLHLFFVRSSFFNGKFSNPRLSIHFLSFSFNLHFVHFRFSLLPFLTSFNRSFKPFSHLINDKMNFNQSFVL